MSSSLCLGAAGRDNIAGQTVLNSKLAAIAFFLFVIIYEIEWLTRFAFPVQALGLRVSDRNALGEVIAAVVYHWLVDNPN